MDKKKHAVNKISVIVDMRVQSCGIWIASCSWIQFV